MVKDASFKTHVNMVSKVELGIALGRAGFVLHKELDLYKRQKMPSILLYLLPTPG